VKINFHEKAREDLHDAANWYLENAPESIQRNFFIQFSKTLIFIQENPTLLQQKEFGTRAVRMDKFPYKFIYRVNNDSITILALSHFRKKSDHWHDH